MQSTTRRPLAAACTFALAGLAAPLAFPGDTTISAGKLARDAKDFYGKTVTVKAEVETVVDGHTFTLDEDSLLAGSDVVVLVPSGMTAGLRHDDKVIVTGQVRRYVVAELDRDYDWFEDGKIVKAETGVDFKSRPVLVATGIRMADGRELLGTNAAATMDSHSHAAHASHDSHAAHKDKDKHKDMKKAHMKTIGAGKLARDAKDFYGQTVSVKAEVETILDGRSFTLDEDSLLAGSDVLVLVPAGVVSGLRKDDNVIVTGQVRRYVAAELDRDYEWFEDGKIVQAETGVDFKTRPVLVATSVRTADGRELLTTAMGDQ